MTIMVCVPLGDSNMIEQFIDATAQVMCYQRGIRQIDDNCYYLEHVQNRIESKI